MVNRLGKHSSGCCMQMSSKSGGSGGAASDDVIIKGAVGRGGMNQSIDVKRIQNALNNIPAELGGPKTPLVPDGIVGNLTIGAIEAFQIRHFASKDGRVDVLGRSNAKISSLQPLKIARMIDAKKYLDDALSSMTLASGRLTSAKLALSSGSTLFGGPDLDHVDRIFAVRQSNDPSAAIDKIAATYREMLRVFARPGGLWGWLTFEAEAFANPQFFAYTYVGGFHAQGQFYGYERMDTVYLSAFYDQARPIDRIQTIIHELAHFAGPRAGDTIQDYAYGTTDQMASLSPYQKQHNAECFGNFAIQCKFGKHKL